MGGTRPGMGAEPGRGQARDGGRGQSWKPGLAGGGDGADGSGARAVGWCGVTGAARAAPLVGARLEGAALAAPMDGQGRPGQAMAMLLCLGMTAVLALGCLHCDPNFSEKFSFYRHHVNLKSWWVGDIPVSGVLLSQWSQNTMKELHLAIPAEISERRSPSQGQKSSRDQGRAAHLLPLPPALSPREAGASGRSRVPEDGPAVPGEDVLPR